MVAGQSDWRTQVLTIFAKASLLGDLNVDHVRSEGVDVSFAKKSSPPTCANGKPARRDLPASCEWFELEQKNELPWLLKRSVLWKWWCSRPAY